MHVSKNIMFTGQYTVLLKLLGPVCPLGSQHLLTQYTYSYMIAIAFIKRNVVHVYERKLI